MASDFLTDFIQVNIGSMDLSANHRITQVVEVVTEMEKRDRMLHHLEKIMDGKDNGNKVLIFTGTKRVADEITRFLRQDGWPALCKLIHSMPVFSFPKVKYNEANRERPSDPWRQAAERA